MENRKSIGKNRPDFTDRLLTEENMPNLETQHCWNWSILFIMYFESYSSNFAVLCQSLVPPLILNRCANDWWIVFHGIWKIISYYYLHSLKVQMIGQGDLWINFVIFVFTLILLTCQFLDIIAKWVKVNCPLLGLSRLEIVAEMRGAPQLVRMAEAFTRIETWEEMHWKERDQALARGTPEIPAIRGMWLRPVTPFWEFHKNLNFLNFPILGYFNMD